MNGAFCMELDVIKISTSVCLLCLACGAATAQSAIERHVWQDKRSFPPSGRTAQIITGPITLSGNSEFASIGTKMTITFGNGRSVNLTAAGASYREWSLAEPGKKVTAEVFRMDHDPGALENGNTLCGSLTKTPARYIVFHEERLFGRFQSLGAAVFSSKRAPKDINSPGLCGTFGYQTN